ncbi:MAG: PAS domain S-box protein [Williamsia sp.]|nr:PAS domain S-box protein [Williamsia sp.]
MTRKIQLDTDTLLFFASIFSNAHENCILIMNEEGMVLGVSSSFTAYFHYTEDDLVGKFPRMLFTPEDQQQKKFEREIENVRTQGFSSDDNYLVNKNGVYTWVSGEAVLVENNRKEKFIVKIVQSIHEQKTLETSLRNSSNFVESIFKCMRDALVVVNGSFTIQKANTAFRSIFWPSHQQVEGENLFEINPVFSTASGLRQKIQDLTTGNDCIPDGEIELVAPDGKRRNFKSTLSLIEDEPATEKRVLIAFHETTAEREANEQRDDLIGFASHELRNPLANMVLCTELLQDSIEENNPEEAQDYLSRIKFNINRLNTIISELHDATKAGSGHLQIEKKPFIFEDMVNESIETVKLLHPAYTIIKTGHATIQINADRYRLVQVMNNYLSNAIKYSFESRKVWVHLQAEAGQVITEVRDEGTGIAEDQLPFIFTRYFRAAKTMNVEGLGLGLYLSSEIIKAHGGRVWLNSKEGEGSTFYFSIPLA